MKWISVKDKLPEKLQRVICRDIFKQEHVATYGINGYNIKNWGLSLCDCCDRVDEITHWMPFNPEPLDSEPEKGTISK